MDELSAAAVATDTADSLPAGGAMDSGSMPDHCGVHDAMAATTDTSTLADGHLQVARSGQAQRSRGFKQLAHRCQPFNMPFWHNNHLQFGSNHSSPK